MSPMKASPRVRRAFLQVVDNQLRDDTPPETRRTLARLMAEGYSRDEARRLIANVVACEFYDMLKNRQPYDEAGYVANLERLPTPPWDD